MPWASGGIPRDGDLETLLEQVAQMRFDTDVGQHPSENDLADAALAQLQHEVVGLRTPDLVRTDDDRFPILDVGFESLEPVRPGSREPLEGQRSPTSENPVLEDRKSTRLNSSHLVISYAVFCLKKKKKKKINPNAKKKKKKKKKKQKKKKNKKK